MAKVFLDTNIFIDAIHRSPEKNILSPLENHISYISSLSVHIYCYSYKVKIPNCILSSQLEYFVILPLSETILTCALEGPTSDMEDNIQLHSAAEAECDYFLTSDISLLKMKFFGKTKIVNTLTKK